MSKKVLGVPIKWSKCFGTNNGIRYEIAVYESELVSVRLASESVDLKALKEFCKENYLPYNQDICNLIEWAEKEAKNQAGEKK